MKKILSLMMAMLFLILCLPLTALAEGEAAPEAISGSYNSEAAAYIWQFGEMSATEQTSVSYSDSYAAIQIGLDAGDGISSDGIPLPEPAAWNQTTPMDWPALPRAGAICWCARP